MIHAVIQSLSLSLLLAIASHDNSETPRSFELLVQIGVSDLSTGAPIDATVLVETPQTSATVDRIRIGSYEARMTIDGTGGAVLNIAVSAAGFTPRKLPIDVGPKQSRLGIHVPMQPEGVPITDRYYLRGLPLFGLGQYEEALCYYEHGYVSGNWTQWRTCRKARLLWNYIRALYDACIRLDYATCQRAAGIAHELLTEYDNYRDGYVCAGVFEDMLDDVIRNVGRRSIQLQYEELKVLLQAKQNDLAAEGFLALLEEYKEDPGKLRDVRLTRDRLQEDAAVALIRTAEDASSAQDSAAILKAHEALDRAEHLLTSMNAPGRSVLDNLSYTRELRMVLGG